MEKKSILIKEADLLKMVSRVVEKWKFVLVVMLCFAIFGMVIALGTAKNYTAEIVVAPEASGSSFADSGFGSLASMMGVDFGANAGGDAIYPILYPDIIKSTPFLTSLFDVRVQNLEGTVDTTYYAYLRHYREKTWLDYVKAMPSKAVNWVVGLFTSSPSDVATSDFNPYMLSRSQMSMVESLNSKIGIFVDKKTYVVTLSFTDREPRVVAAMADTIMNRLQQEVTLYRTKKALNDCKYVEKMYLDAKDSLELSQERYADFVSHNKNVINEFVIIEKERLGADKDLKTTLYTQWAQQLMLAKAKVQENTPVFVTLKPATIPVKASSMGRMARTMLFAFVGAVFAAMYILLKEPLKKICKRLFGANK
ncbi:MAG: chain-length determining protein [Bacteroidaceae bacterium]|nr:chain-length determining protein [Bacteroidaceae bacterium]